MDQLNFQVNLKGMIDLLSNHLYSNPGVFIRELLQNGVDAVTARKRLGHKFEEKVTVELFPSSRTMAVHDNGIGLSEEEIHRFLSNIGSTSKKDRPDDTDDYIGQFGVGLLACFVVSGEIVIITRSALEGDTLEWRGRPDGTYAVRKLESQAPIGTTVFLTCKEDYEEYFEYDRVSELLEHYGAFLPIPVYLTEDSYENRINDSIPPWKMDRKDALEYGETRLYQTCLDVIPLKSAIGEAEGVAYVLPHPVSLQAEKRHKVYLKNMLLSDRMENVLPPWAFFVTCMLNTNALRPTASREAFYENDLFLAVRDELGECIKRHFLQLAETDPELLQRIIRIHYASLKTMAVEDDELYKLFIRFLSFETSMGTMEAGEIAARSKQLLLNATLDEFRQIARVSKAQELMVVNGGYVHDFELIKKLPECYPDVQVVVINPIDFFKRFEELDREDSLLTRPFLELADRVLLPFQCKSAIRWFEPADLPVLYTTNEELGFFKMAESGKDNVNELFQDIVRLVVEEVYEVPFASLCFNFNNPIVRKAVECGDPELQRLSVETLYMQSLLMGNYPLSPEELKLMNQSFMAFLNLGLNRSGGV
ncbi:HSP90 family protein [Paenibacillus thermotolerans]|uniref:HSP90 family protein n=1 Tax=Paenibacillus thermotolerans TaxID=3027807 RepID=UPI002367BF37|nr:MULTISPECIES: HSP90 family protein [unclassified Paenibacillus]